MVANVLVFGCVNVVGILMHNLMEHAQRRAFLDTRNCIAARLEMEDENEKLVYVRCSFCNIIMSMFVLFTGKVALVGFASARRYGNEERHHIAGRRTVSQDLHTETSTSQVYVVCMFIFHI
jgi:hypothetical protein